MSNAELQGAYEALLELAGLMLPVRAALRVRQLIRDVQARLQDVEAERRKLLDAYGKHDDNGQLALDEAGMVTFDDDAKRMAFAEAYSELMSATWSTETALRADDLGDSIQVRPQTLVALGNLLIEERG